MRLIDADALDLDREVELADDWNTAHEIANCVKYAPTIDAVPVVRCKDCKHGEMRKNCYGDDMVECSNPDSPVRDYALTALFLPDWFCADGERKEV